MQNDAEIQNDGPPTESVAPADTASSSTPAPAGDSSGGESKETLLDAVLQAVKPATEDGDEKSDDKEGAPTSENAEGEDQAKENEEPKEDTEGDQDEEAPSTDVPEKTRKKINSLLRQRRELRDEVSTLKPTAEIGTQLQEFAVSHDLSSDDVVNALHIAATLRRGDYKAFYEMVSPFVRHAQEYIGVVLPNDLQQMVEQQQITPEAAREFARTRFDQQRMQVENSRMQEMGQRYFTQEAQADVQRAVADFENRLAANDPDYKAKAGLLQRTARALLAENGGTVTNKQEAIAIVKAAYDEVNAHFRKFSAPKRATAPTPGSTQAQSPAARPQPKSLMEAVVAGLNRPRM